MQLARAASPRRPSFSAGSDPVDKLSSSDEAKAEGAVSAGSAAALPVLPPLAAAIEIVVLIVIPGLLDLFVPAFPSLNETQPHFFWLPVLLLTLQYGSASGLLAAGTAIVLSSLLGWPEQEIGENHFSYQLRIWLQPVLWLATGVILGQLRLRQIERKAALGQAVAELSNQRQSIAEHARNLRERCDRLERVVATRRQPDALALLAALGRVQAGDPDEATRALGEALALGFGRSVVSILVLEDGALRVSYRHAPSGSPSPPAPIGPESPLFGAVVGEHRALSALRPGSEHDLDGRAAAVVPILAADGAAIGAVLLETADPDDLDADTQHRLAAVAGVVAGRLRQTGDARAPRRPPPLAEASARPEDGLWRRVRWQAGRHRPGASRLARKG